MFFGDFTESNEFADAGVNCADCVHRADGTHGRTR
jgi:hypothetical protein